MSRRGFQLRILLTQATLVLDTFHVLLWVLFESFQGIAFGNTVHCVALSQYIKVHPMSVEFRSIYTGKLRLTAN